MNEEWLAALRVHADQIAALDPRQAISTMEEIAIKEAAIILQLLDEIERLKTKSAA
jgi:hypothetical protein